MELAETLKGMPAVVFTTPPTVPESVKEPGVSVPSSSVEGRLLTLSCGPDEVAIWIPPLEVTVKTPFPKAALSAFWMSLTDAVREMAGVWGTTFTATPSEGKVPNVPALVILKLPDSPPTVTETLPEPMPVRPASAV